jgi:excisionase family DNA binding protein
MNERILLRVSEVADLIGVSKATAYDLVNRGSIPSVRLAGRGGRGLLRVPAEALHKLIEEAPAPAPKTNLTPAVPERSR